MLLQFSFSLFSQNLRIITSARHSLYFGQLRKILEQVIKCLFSALVCNSDMLICDEIGLAYNLVIGFLQYKIAEVLYLLCGKNSNYETVLLGISSVTLCKHI